MRSKKIFFTFTFFMGSIALLLAIFNAQADKPWWGLVDNPSAKYRIGTTLNSIEAEFGVNNKKIQEFYFKYKKMPSSFQELDRKVLSGDYEHNCFAEKTGNIAACNIDNSKGYNTQKYTVTYKDGSSCEFELKKRGYKMTCTRKDYWINGKLETYNYQNMHF